MAFSKPVAVHAQQVEPMVAAVNSDQILPVQKGDVLSTLFDKITKADLTTPLQSIVVLRYTFGHVVI